MGGGEITGITADSQVWFCAAGGMGFPVTGVREGKQKMTLLRGEQGVGKKLTLQRLQGPQGGRCVRWALGDRNLELYGEVWTRDYAKQAPQLSKGDSLTHREALNFGRSRAEERQHG